MHATEAFQPDIYAAGCILDCPVLIASETTMEEFIMNHADDDVTQWDPKSIYRSCAKRLSPFPPISKVDEHGAEIIVSSSEEFQVFQPLVNFTLSSPTMRRTLHEINKMVWCDNQIGGAPDFAPPLPPMIALEKAQREDPVLDLDAMTVEAKEGEGTDAALPSQGVPPELGRDADVLHLDKEDAAIK